MFWNWFEDLRHTKAIGEIMLQQWASWSMAGSWCYARIHSVEQSWCAIGGYNWKASLRGKNWRTARTWRSVQKEITLVPLQAIKFKKCSLEKDYGQKLLSKSRRLDDSGGILISSLTLILLHENPAVPLCIMTILHLNEWLSFKGLRMLVWSRKINLNEEV